MHAMNFPRMTSLIATCEGQTAQYLTDKVAGLK